MDIQDGLRFSVVADPQGAVFGILFLRTADANEERDMYRILLLGGSLENTGTKDYVELAEEN